MKEKPTDLDVPVWGAKEIAIIINRSPRQTFHMLSSGVLPAKKVGDRYVSTKRKLLDAVLGEVAA